MAQYEAKTKATDVDVTAFLAKIQPPQKRDDAFALIALFSLVTEEPAKMWGPSIIGFGHYRYTYDSGHSGESCRTGFSPRKTNLVLYLKGRFEEPAEQARLAQLGKHKVGKGCLYINKLADVDMTVLESIIRDTWDSMDAQYPL
jgi:Domain of unknown function (DU1801)